MSLISPIDKLMEKQAASNNRIVISYADECTVLATGKDIPRLTQKISDYLVLDNFWIKEQHLKLCPATLFTLWTK